MNTNSVELKWKILEDIFRIENWKVSVFYIYCVSLICLSRQGFQYLKYIWYSGQRFYKYNKDDFSVFISNKLFPNYKLTSKQSEAVNWQLILFPCLSFYVYQMLFESFIKSRLHCSDIYNDHCVSHLLLRSKLLYLYIPSVRKTWIQT